LSLRLSPPQVLADETWEKLRQLAIQSSEELSEALAPALKAASGRIDSEWQHAYPGRQVFWDAMQSAEAELSVPGFERLPAAPIAEVMRTVATLALDGSTRHLEGTGVDSLEQSLSRWKRRKLRKALDGLDASDIDAVDWEAWRNELRAVSASLALDRCGGDLRAALMALATADLEEPRGELSESANIGDLVAGSPTAYSLLLRVALAWCDQLAQEL
jgi:hypothetical protein